MTGCVASVSTQSLHLEANVPPLDDLARHIVVKKLERDKRLPLGDFRRTEADASPQASAQVLPSKGVVPTLHETPQLSATLELQNVLRPPYDEPS